MEKICNILLNYNLGEMTDSVYEELKPYIDEDTDIIVYDVSDDDKNKSKYTTNTGKDEYFGGNFKNILLKMLENEKKYDWFVLMSNDVYDFPNNNWLRELVNQANKAGAKIVTPCLNIDSSHFEHMHQIENAEYHFVNWVDFPCPIIHRSLIENVIEQWTNMLKYGWGIDSLFGLYCYDNNIPIIVSDTINIKHHREKTFKDEVDKLSRIQYCQRASMSEAVFFNNLCGADKWVKWRDDIRNKINMIKWDNNND